MFEDISDGTLIMGMVTIVAILIAGGLASAKAKAEGRESSAGIWTFIAIFLFVGVYYYADVSTKKSVLATYKSFKKGEDLMCYVMGKTYIVSKKDWKLYKNGFRKGDLLIDVQSCHVEE